MGFHAVLKRRDMDFCQKYSHTRSAPNSLTHFILKLKQKNQTEQQIEQAKQAIFLFYKLIESYTGDSSKSSTKKKESTKKSDNDSPTETNISKNQSWENELEILTNEIKLRQYSRKTLKAYTSWVGSFQAYLKSKSTKPLDSIDAKNFITYLAVEKKFLHQLRTRHLMHFYSSIAMCLKENLVILKISPGLKEPNMSPQFCREKRSMQLLIILNTPTALLLNYCMDVVSG